MKNHYVKVRVKNENDPNLFGRVQVSAIRRLITGKYQAKVHQESKRKPLLIREDLWFDFKKKIYGTVYNDQPILDCGETLVFGE